MNKEAILGIVIVFVIFGFTAAVMGIYGIIILGITFLVAAISINLFSRKSVAAKTAAVILNTDLIYKILMPRKHKIALRELEAKEREKENHKKS